MEFLVTATPMVPLTDPAVLRKLADWLREQQRAGRIKAAYGFVGGGGCSVMDVATPEELHEYTLLCPIGNYMTFDIKPLIDLSASFEMGRGHLQAAGARG